MNDTPSVRVGVIGGSGLYRLFDEPQQTLQLRTPFGPPSGPIRIGQVNGRHIAFLARHGEDHHTPPHKVDYRANIWALASLGVTAIVTSAAVGGLSEEARPGRFVLPDQLIDRTWGRADTFYDRDDVQHLPAADPYCPQLRETAISALAAAGEDVLQAATSVVIQGPRFSTRAESRWFAAAGADIVNMTQYPEAVLAAELNIGLVNLSFVTDRDAGAHHDDEETADAELVLRRMAEAAPRILAAVRSIAAGVSDDYTPRQLVAPEAVARVLALPARDEEPTA